MSKIDNFDLLAGFLFKTPLSGDEFYFLQILVRGKDCGENKNRMVRYYTITSKEQFCTLKDEIVSLCRVNKGRAYIHPTKRSFKEVAGLALELSAHMYVSQQYSGLKSAYSTACGKSFITSDKKFVVDLDDVDRESLKGLAFINEVTQTIYKIRGYGGENYEKVLHGIPTKSGIHLISRPFDVGQFNAIYPNIDVHKNNPTLLYYEW